MNICDYHLNTDGEGHEVVCPKCGRRVKHEKEESFYQRMTLIMLQEICEAVEDIRSHLYERDR